MGTMSRLAGILMLGPILGPWAGFLTSLLAMTQWFRWIEFPLAPDGPLLALEAQHRRLQRLFQQPLHPTRVCGINQMWVLASPLLSQVCL